MSNKEAPFNIFADLLNVRMDHFAKTGQDRIGRDEGMKWQGKQAVKQGTVDLASSLAHFGRILFEGATLPWGTVIAICARTNSVGNSMRFRSCT